MAQLAAGYHVIASRYYFSSLAYQSEFADPAWVASLNLLAKRTLPADLTIFLDLDPQTSLQRIEARSEHREIYETLAKLTHVRQSFQLAFEHFGEGERIRTIDAAGTVPKVADAVGRKCRNYLSEIIPRNRGSAYA